MRTTGQEPSAVLTMMTARHPASIARRTFTTNGTCRAVRGSSQVTKQSKATV